MVLATMYLEVEEKIVRGHLPAREEVLGHPALIEVVGHVAVREDMQEQLAARLEERRHLRRSQPA